MAEAALRKSRDVGELKKFRAAIKGQVTGALNKLETLLHRKSQKTLITEESS